MQNNFIHTTVLLHEAVDALNIKENGIYIDGTFGLGGHSRLILSRLGKKGKLFAIERDLQAINLAKIDDPRCIIIHDSFSNLAHYISVFGLTGKVCGILIDLGVSSLQLEKAERGFSFMKDGPLDMRMNPTSGITAAEWLQQAKEKDIASVLKMYGEERFSRRIARAIVERNRLKPITSTKELSKIIATSIPIKNKFKHPARRSFQAIRIWINRELEEIEKMLRASLEALAPGGRLSITTFHSLEGRLVKRFIQENSRGVRVPARFPITESQLQKFIGRCYLKSVGKILPNETEITKNPRARSAVLRIAERTVLS